ncbi:MAG: hypothetical protein ABL883_09660 [Terricaulis sp.]
MSPSTLYRAAPDGGSFAEFHAAAAHRSLTEIIPAAPADGAAAFGFALAWLKAGDAGGLVVISSPQVVAAELGAAYAPGLMQFGIDLGRLVWVRTRSQKDALWCTEQALRTPHATAFCVVTPTAKPLSLVATRRLLLAGETHATRCVLLRLDQAGASAAWTRLSVAAAPSQGAGRELGAPRFAVRLTRNRAGPTGQSWLLEWNAYALRIAERALDGAVAGATADRSADPRQRRAV